MNNSHKPASSSNAGVMHVFADVWEHVISRMCRAKLWIVKEAHLGVAYIKADGRLVTAIMIGSKH